MSMTIGREDRGSVSYLMLVCLVAALGGMLFGYDTAVINGAIGFLQKHFGLTPAMKGWAASSALAGCIIGVCFGGLSDRIGRKKTLLLAGVLYLVSAVGTAVPRSFTTFIIYRIIGGAGVGIASMACPMYIAEISPARIRGRMVSVNQFAIVSGMLIIYFVNYFIKRQGTEAWNVDVGWRWMFGSEALPAAAFLLLLFFIPESPRWLIGRGRKDEALRILTRVGGRESALREFGDIEQSLREENVPLRELLRPGLRAVLIIGIALAVLQQVTGINVFLYFGTEIFKGLGSNVDAALLQSIVIGAANMLFTIIAIRTVDTLGRKPLMVIGSIGMGVSLLAMGLAAQLNVMGSFMLIFTIGYIACFALSVGPVTWVLLSEMFPTKIRGRALSAATLCLWTANLIVSQTFPMMDENATLIAKFNHAFPFYVYALFCVALVLTVWLFVPETKGRSLEEIERFWGAEKRAFPAEPSRADD